MDHLRRNFPILTILTIYLACIIIADPRGEFPLNDDWSYARSAFALGSGHGLKVDQWAAPSLVGQALYGGLLTKLLSPSFLVLRASTVLLSSCTLLLLWGILLRMGVRKGLASIILLAWAFNPLQFNLSFTYMTEIPFIFFIALALYLYIIHLDNGNLRFLLLSAAALGYAFLIRQTALLFIVALACSVLLDAQKGVWKRSRQMLAAAGIAGIFVAGYYLWVHFGGGTTAAVHRKFQLLRHLETRQLVGNGYGTLFYLAFMLLPVLIYLIPRANRRMRASHRIPRTVIPVAWCGIVVIGIWWFHAHASAFEYLPSASYHSRMPYLLNVLYDSGLGPVTLDPTYFGALPTPSYPRVWYAITAIVAAGAVFGATLCVFWVMRLREAPLFQNQKPLLVFAGLSFLGLAAFEIVFSHLQEGGLFDRHILTAALPMFLILICIRVPNGRIGAPVSTAGAAALLAAGAWLSICGTHDYLAWNRARWDLGRQALSSGVDPLGLSGGFEFNAWHNYDVFRRRGNIGRVYYWWYDRPDYVIALEPQEAYRVRQREDYSSWLHARRMPVYLLEKARE